MAERKASEARQEARRRMIRTAEAFIVADRRKAMANDALPLADPKRAAAQREADERERDLADAIRALRVLVVAEDVETTEGG